MPRSTPASSRRNIRKSLFIRCFLVITLCAASLSSLALSGRNGHIASEWVREWVRWPLRLIEADMVALGPIPTSRDGDELIVQSPSVFQRLRAAWVARRGLLEGAQRQSSFVGTTHKDAGNGMTQGGAAIPVTGTPSIAMGRSNLPELVSLRTNLSYVNLNSSAYSRFKAYVDKAVGGNPDWGFSASDSVIMYQLSKQQKYCDLAVSMTEQQVSAAESRISSGSAPEIAGDSYLYVGPMLADLAMTYQVCAASLNSSQKQRWAAYADQTVWNIWNYNQAKWGGKTIAWSGWSTSNPGNNYYYSFLEATMYWALASQNQTWLNFLRQTKLPALTNYFNQLPGGGSLEGTGYGTSHMNLFANYMLWRDNTGEDLANANTHATDSIRYWVHATVPTLDRFAPIGDQARTSVPVLYDYQRRVVLEARYLTNDPNASNIASWWLNNISIRQMTNSFNTRYDMLPTDGNGVPPNELVYLAKGTGNLFARTGWDTAAMWVAFIAGPYNESHAHQEQGAFTLFSGDWLAVTENIWTHSGIQQGTSLNNILRFEKNGSVVPQVEGTTSSMTVTPSSSGGAFAADATLTPAYGGNSAVQNWKRHLDFAARKLTVTDNFAVGSGTSATFQINVPVQPQVNGNQITAGKLKVKVLSPSNPTIKLINWKNVDSSEYTSGWRIDISGSASNYVVELSDS